MEITQESITLQDLLALKKGGMLNVNAEYQRAAVWSESQQKKLIDSVMRRYPLPLFYFHHKIKTVAGMRSESLEIIDGQQRINALFRFGEGALKLFDPIKDDKTARFPNFIKDFPSPWAHCDFVSLSAELKAQFLNTVVFIVKVSTDVEDEARDLFIRLQAGLPLNAQEKRDAWPGGFTELVLRLGGKQEIARYPGHDFFRYLVKKSARDRGEGRQLCAQICMLFFDNATQGNWTDIGTQDIDDYYYRNLGFDPNAANVSRLYKVLDLIVELFVGQKAPKFKAYEAIHIVLLVNGLLDDYTKSWQSHFVSAYDSFKLNLSAAKKDQASEHWTEFGAWTQTQTASARTIQRRHTFFSKEMMPLLHAVLLDPTRAFGEVDREVVYFRDAKLCAVCGQAIRWPDLEVHHVEEHQHGGRTDLENAVAVHKDCHPKGQAALAFRETWVTRRHKLEEARRVSLATAHGNELTTAERTDSPLPRTVVRLPPEGTRCRFTYAGREYRGTVADGGIEIDDMPGRYLSFSAASGAVSNTSRNGWEDWELLIPGNDDWLPAAHWRKSVT